MDDELRELLYRIDERVKHLDERVDRIEYKLESMNVYVLKRNNYWRERGIGAMIAGLIVGFLEALRRLVGGV